MRNWGARERGGGREIGESEKGRECEIGRVGSEGKGMVHLERRMEGGMEGVY